MIPLTLHLSIKGTVTKLGKVILVFLSFSITDNQLVSKVSLIRCLVMLMWFLLKNYSN